MVSPPPDKEHFLPSREISYAYTAAMHFAQRFEQNLRVILYNADRHGWISGIDLTEEEKRRFKDAEGLIDSATCGKLIEVLRKSDWIKQKKVFALFERACKHRNTLAHRYLASHQFDGLTKKKEEAIIHELHRFTIDLYGGLIVSRAIRERCEVEAKKIQAYLDKLAKEIEMDDYSDVT